MKHFTYEEMELMSIYDPGTREGLIATWRKCGAFWSRTRTSCGS